MIRKSKGSEDPYNKSLDLLARRDHTAAELAAKLQGYGFQKPAVEDVLARLSAAGLIDDARFAARWVDSALRHGRGYGTKLLFDLQQKGVSREIAQQAISAASAETPVEQVMQEIVSKRFTGFNNATATMKERQRIYSYLQRRGFQLSTIISYFKNQFTE